MARANNDALADLHAEVAKVLNAKVGETIELEDEDGNKRSVYMAEPATLQAAIKFLKDNDITCDPADDENLEGLAEKLRAKQRVSGRPKLKAVGEES